MINCGPSPSKYLLPPIVGYQNHDVRLERKPAYTFGVRTSNKEIDVGPGPAKYLLTDVSRYGKSMQIAHHFGKRYRQKEISDTPASNAYRLPDARRYPMYSFGSRWISEVGSNGNPSPAHYVLPRSICGDDMTLKRAPIYSISGRQPIQISQSFGPGPAAYLPILDKCKKILPTIKSRYEHDLSSDTPAPNAYSSPDFRKYPAYSFGIRWKSGIDLNQNPSPAHYQLPSSIGGSDVTSKRAPKYSLVGRQPILMSQSVGPGSATYLPIFKNGNKILPTIKSRTGHKISADNPAPNAYGIPDIQKNPAFSFGSRWNTEVDSNGNPSPADYQLPSSIGGDDVTLNRTPKYSIVGNQPIFVSQSFGPGPATYLPSPSNANKIMPTIKSRIEQTISSDTPAPNAYSLPETRQYPAYSFASRRNDEVDLNGNHSVAHYQLPSSFGGGDFIFNRAPIYSISNRCPIPSMQSFGPGPAAYLPNSESCKKLLPTLKFRTVHEISSDTPAPNHYFLQNYKPGIRGPSYTIARRKSVLAESTEC